MSELLGKYWLLSYFKLTWNNVDTLHPSLNRVQLKLFSNLNYKISILHSLIVRLLSVMVNVYSTVLLVIFLLALIVIIVTALTVRKKKKINAQNYDKNRIDKAWMAGMKAYSKAYYIQHNKRVKTQARIAYKINRKNKLASASALSKLVHALNPESIKAKCRMWYNKNKASKQIKSRRYSKLKYSLNPQKSKERSAKTYSQNPQPIKQRAREHSAVIYTQNPEPQRKRAREFSAKSYKDDPEPKKLKSREIYKQNSDSKKNNALKRYCTNRNAILSLLRGDYVKNNYSKRAIA